MIWRRSRNDTRTDTLPRHGDAIYCYTETMDAELTQKLQEQAVKIEEIREAVKATRRYMQITFWVTIIFLVLPLFGLLYAVPKAMNSYMGMINIDTLDGLEGL
jgi:hypothetical protein